MTEICSSSKSAEKKLAKVVSLVRAPVADWQRERRCRVELAGSHPTPPQPDQTGPRTWIGHHTSSFVSAYKSHTDHTIWSVDCILPCNCIVGIWQSSCPQGLRTWLCRHNIVAKTRPPIYHITFTSPSRSPLAQKVSIMKGTYDD